MLGTHSDMVHIQMHTSTTCAFKKEILCENDAHAKNIGLQFQFRKLEGNNGGEPCKTLLINLFLGNDVQVVTLRV